MQSKSALAPILFLLALTSSGCSGNGSKVVISHSNAYKAKNGIDKKDIEVAVREHNRVREDVGVGKLTWSDDIGRYAQAWADHLAATTCQMKHRPREGKWKQRYGENLFIGTAGFYSIREAVQSWESEKADYSYGTFTGKSRKPIGHYTQIIWKNSTKLGCGQALCNGNLIVACNYDPPGNYIGQKPY
jgi:pathogenesis-related protein 1